MTKVKICGITTRDDAQVAVEAGADMIGLIFYPPSPRYVTPEQAYSIVAHLPPGCSAVGVFVNEDLDTVTHIARTSGVHMVQLHGTESPELCQQLPWPVIKTFRFTAQVQPEIMQQYGVEALLIEGFHPDVYGGGGVPGRLATRGLVAPVWPHHARRRADVRECLRGHLYCPSICRGCV